MTEGFEEFEQALKEQFDDSDFDEITAESEQGTDEIKERVGIFDALIANKTPVYSVIFYAAGLFVGTYFYLKCQNDTLNSLLFPAAAGFTELLLDKLCIYLLISIFTVLLGICLIGFSLVNIMPLLIGVQTGLKIAYFYVNYNVKGVGYALIMVAPFVSFFTAVIIYTASHSYKLSKSIWAAAVKHESLDEGKNYKHYLKTFTLCILLSALAALINSAVITALGGIIAI